MKIDDVHHLSWQLRNSIIHGYTCSTACAQNNHRKEITKKAAVAVGIKKYRPIIYVKTNSWYERTNNAQIRQLKMKKKIKNEAKGRKKQGKGIFIGE